MKKYCFYTLILISLLFNSCNKGGSEGGNHLYLLDEKLNPLLFNVGSEWVYQNETDNNLDTVIVNEASFDTTEAYNVGGGFTATDLLYTINYSSNLNGLFTEIYRGYLIYRGIFNDKAIVYLSSFRVGDSSYNAKIVAIYDTLLINNKSFKNVVKMRVNKADYLESDLILYYADSVGVIRKEIIKNNQISETWSLLNYNVSLNHY